MRGASALQAALSRVPDPEMRAFLVWMPVVASDMGGPPPDSVLAIVSDPRVAQFWDPARRLSDRFAAAFVADSTLDPPDRGWAPGEVVWDAVLVYPPGERFGAGVPRHAWSGHPLVAWTDSLAARLGAAP